MAQARGHKKRATNAPRSRRGPANSTARGRAQKAARAKARSRRGAKIPKLRFAKADRVFHLVDPAAFVKTEDAEGFQHLGPAKDARTACCDRPIAKVWGVAVSKDSFKPPVKNWCKGVA
jgi:hypothetical protein